MPARVLKGYCPSCTKSPHVTSIVEETITLCSSMYTEEISSVGVEDLVLDRLGFRRESLLFLSVCGLNGSSLQQNKRKIGQEAYVVGNGDLETGLRTEHYGAAPAETMITRLRLDNARMEDETSTLNKKAEKAVMMGPVMATSLILDFTASVQRVLQNAGPLTAAYWTALPEFQPPGEQALPAKATLEPGYDGPLVPYSESETSASVNAPYGPQLPGPPAYPVKKEEEEDYDNIYEGLY